MTITYGIPQLMKKMFYSPSELRQFRNEKMRPVAMRYYKIHAKEMNEKRLKLYHEKR
jgi:hypothetical protein